MNNNELIKTITIAASTVLGGIVIAEGGKCLRCHEAESTRLKMCRESNDTLRFVDGQKTLRQENRIALVSSAIKILAPSAFTLH